MTVHLLMIENHAVFAETVAAELFSEDDVVIVPGTQRALTRLEEGPRFDAVLVDFHLDDGIGTDLVRELRESGYEGVIVAMSAKEHGNALLVRAGADVACSKMEFRSVRPLLESLLERVQIDAPRIDRAVVALEGLSVGDAFGECFFGPDDWAIERVRSRRLPAAPWTYTDDTEMATALVEVLAEHEHVDPSALARAFARRFAAEPDRGYGGGACRLLQQIRDGVPWRDASQALFAGQGSIGNGGAMRVAPVGAYLAEDLLSVLRQARISAAVTHAHIEGQAGAVAVAAAAAYVCRKKHCPDAVGSTRLLPFAERLCPPGPTRDALRFAQRLPAATTPSEAAELLGSGSKLLSSDTVPFALWCAERHMDDFPQALWATVQGLGDRDTTCAMVGGIIGSLSPPPARWQRAREPLRFEKPPRLHGALPSLRDRAEAWAWALRGRRWPQPR